MRKKKQSQKETVFNESWLTKSLESLENDVWAESQDDSYLISTCLSLRKKKLKEYEIEDLRIMIGQDIGLRFLIPIAIQKLQTNILAEGDYYEGDLLMSVLNSDIAYWKQEIQNWKFVCELFEQNTGRLKNEVSDHGLLKDIFNSGKSFKTIN
ncbi:hypothetical protein J0X14_12130 [Muricauda sp. CAU 1633]|uniref:contact-dependent growth inhibition system immunity protein n=1 Tax=Allomuricauda sp. CAU 1633 TaxID=2816036 RepID=UPI001A8C37BA|nr:contact-dependent growth inhibition system immunity protein [Muricauda sp. CAU 1633]MBO0323047.1 hypothetical protein [Muricauda sp. CAU 1633]